MTDGSIGGPPAEPPNERRARPPLLSIRSVALAGAALLLVIVVVVVAHYRGGSERRRYEAIMKTALDRLVTAQEGFYYDSMRYSPSLRALPTVKLPPGVHVELFNPDRRSWWAVATHDRLPSRRCVVWVGTAPTVLPLADRLPEDETKPLCHDASQLAGLALSFGP